MTLVFDENLTGEECKVVLKDEETFYRQIYSHTIVDSTGQPIAIKMENGNMFNWDNVMCVVRMVKKES